MPVINSPKTWWENFSDSSIHRGMKRRENILHLLITAWLCENNSGIKKQALHSPSAIRSVNILRSEQNYLALILLSTAFARSHFVLSASILRGNLANWNLKRIKKTTRITGTIIICLQKDNLYHHYGSLELPYQLIRYAIKSDDYNQRRTFF